ncbi:uncharacterized protein BYT42DRAFT_553801 [Radiomyces spectabilis]|uniref:uncharacterized protein n=1 Tax=Radiomyces spectabilis TaxID=64574 RepID=UPI0022208293|nr:uncharacterized protein BYT42DRAFT_553801 [Radiomyces spectabilis]KAI8394242.1 hypothetical protein BYT42DRAFT_553801 [Radiomyces spectabilis]
MINQCFESILTNNTTTCRPSFANVCFRCFSFTNTLHSCSSQWVISDLDVSRRFSDFREDVIRNGHEHTSLDQSFNQLLISLTRSFIYFAN